MKTASLPVLLKPKEGGVVLVGAGKVGLHKAEVLAANGIAATVIAPAVHAGFEGVPLHRVLRKNVAAGDLKGASVVIDATGDNAVTEMLLGLKAAKGFLLNVVDVPSLCDFYFASLLHYGPLKIAVSSDGASPTLTQCVRDKIRRTLPPELETLAREKAGERSGGMIDAAATRNATGRLLASVSLVGCGPGDVELLTLKAYHIIKEADVILYDHLISEEILALIPTKSIKIYVGKRKGCHSRTQDEINRMIVQYAEKGCSVARLKSGDPYIFGRGAEEAAYLAEKGFRVSVVAGISSAIAGPAVAGIPVTARGYAANFSVVSAHLKGAKTNLSWIDLLRQPDHTTVVLMGLSLSRAIRDAALERGISRTLPAAIVSNATRPNQQTRVTTLGKLADAAGAVEGPAIIVFGDVVRLHAILPGYLEGGKRAERAAANAV
ncbi:uroporphyrinogen-III C-methyltransferase [Sulfurimonas diazotrophicus]|uniref:Uroporphyrinogen-III C-methyltransferase n=1 Tax=Sulfurimonas diazotrophicus TaxID=3131939 RepID=A0ABZ3H9R3_9BACT